MNELLKNIRFYILSFSLLLSLGIFLYIKTTIPSGTIQTIKLTQIYALLSITYLYFTLMATPVVRYFKFIPFRSHYIKARRSLGISSFYFACLHVYLAFFKQLGGFAGLGFLSSKYLIAIALSFTAFVIMALMASTSFDKMIDKLSFEKWKFLHRFIYLAGILILIHAMMLGTHFAELSSLIPKIFFSALSLLFILEAKRFDEYLNEKFENLPSFGLTALVIVGIIVYLLSTYVFTKDTNVSLGIHSQHLLQAQQDQNYKLNVVMSPLENIYPKRNTNISFKVFNAANGDLINDFSVNQEKLMHLIIVNNDLTFFDHVHPEFKNGAFSINYSFPKEGTYRLYTDFQPKGMVEQKYTFKVNVGSAITNGVSQNKDFSTEKTIGDIKASLILPKVLSAKSLSEGKSIIGFKFSENGNDVKNIEPYLAAFGHLVMVKTDTYDYVHVHPKQSYTPFEGETSGPLVEFSPLGLYGNIQPGIYKIYGQFMISGKLHTYDFFVRVEE